MDYFGINSADDLPKIKEVLAEQSVIQGTLINDAIKNPPEAEEEIPSIKEEDTGDLEIGSDKEEVTTLIVADTGELIEQPAEKSTDETKDPEEKQSRTDLPDEPEKDNSHNLQDGTEE